eukprot:Platyproteum_vivax@DN5838_c0_g1_i1.p1
MERKILTSFDVEQVVSAVNCPYDINSDPILLKCRDTIERLWKEVEDERDIRLEVEKQLSDRNCEVDEISSSFKKVDTRCKSLEALNLELKQKNYELEEHIEKLSENCDAQTKISDECQAITMQKANEAKTQDLKMQNLQEKLSHVEISLQRAEQEVDNLAEVNQHVQEVEEENLELKQKLDSLSREETKNKVDAADLEARVHRQQSQIEDLAAAKNRFELNLQKSREQCEELSSEAKNNIKLQSDLEAANWQNKQITQKYTAEIRRLEEQIHNEKETIRDFEKKDESERLDISKIEAQLMESKSHVATLNHEISQLYHKEQSLERELKASKDGHKAAETHVQKFSDELAHLQKKTKLLETANEKLSTESMSNAEKAVGAGQECRKLSLELEDLQTALEKGQRIIDSLERAKEKGQSEVSRLSDRISDLQTDLVHSAQECQMLKDAAAEAQHIKREVELQAHKLQKVAKNKAESLKERDVEVLSLNKESTELRSESSQLRLEAANLRSEAAVLRQELNDAREIDKQSQSKYKEKLETLKLKYETKVSRLQAQLTNRQSYESRLKDLLDAEVLALRRHQQEVEEWDVWRHRSDDATAVRHLISEEMNSVADRLERRICAVQQTPDRLGMPLERQLKDREYTRTPRSEHRDSSRGRDTPRSEYEPRMEHKSTPYEYPDDFKGTPRSEYSRLPLADRARNTPRQTPPIRHSSREARTARDTEYKEYSRERRSVSPNEHYPQRPPIVANSSSEYAPLRAHEQPSFCPYSEREAKRDDDRHEARFENAKRDTRPYSRPEPVNVLGGWRSKADHYHPK